MIKNVIIVSKVLNIIFVKLFKFKFKLVVNIV